MKRNSNAAATTPWPISAPCDDDQRVALAGFLLRGDEAIAVALGVLELVHVDRFELGAELLPRSVSRNAFSRARAPMRR